MEACVKDLRESIHQAAGYQARYLLTSNNLLLKIIETGENLVMPVVFMEGLKKGQNEEKNKWADSFPIMC